MQKADLSVLIGKQKTNVLFCVHCFYNLFQHRVNHLVTWIFSTWEHGHLKLLRILMRSIGHGYVGHNQISNLFYFLLLYKVGIVVRNEKCYQYLTCCDCICAMIMIFFWTWNFLKKLNTANKSRYSTFFLQIFVMRNFSWLNNIGFI